MVSTALSPAEALPGEAGLSLERTFRRFDVTFFAVCTVIGLDTIGAVASDGGQAFTWMLFLAAVFFLPYALLTAELGAAFPVEGGPYVWIRLAFGRIVGAVASVFYWISNPIWLGGTLAVTSMAAIGQLITPLSGAGQYIFGLLFIWVSTAGVIVSARYGKWLPTLGAFLRATLLSFFTLTVIIYAAEHGVHGLGGSSFSPTWAVFIAAVPVLAFNYVGLEVPSAASGEIRDPQRAIPFAVARSGAMVVLLYGIPILAIILLLPARQITNLSGFLDAIKLVLTIYGGHVAAGGAVTLTGAGKVIGVLVTIGFVLALMFGAVAWLMGADRAQAIAARDGAAPAWMGRFSERFGTPIAVNLMSGAMATVFLVLALTLTSGNAAKYFSAVLGLVISTTLISYVAICPAVIRLRYTHGDARRPYRLPFGNAGAWICGLLGTLWSLLATVVLLWPGLGTADPGASLPSGFAGQRLQYELTQLVPVALLLALGLLFGAVGSRRIARSAAGP
ncbi:MAG TPA: APC family permease [Solirubrobacteraceae bacterium]|nr:APC family permease [Solirubrobacteraceae bacterium]